MKNLLLSTSVVILTAVGANAQTTNTTDTGMPSYMAGDLQISADQMIGKRVYIGRETAAMVDETMLIGGVADVPDDWDDMGEVGDVLLSEDGELNSIVVDAGGFLGMGEHQVQVPMDSLQIVQDNDTDGDYFIVYTGDRATLEGTESFDSAMAEGAGLRPIDREAIPSDSADADAMNTELATDDVALAEETTDADMRAARDSMTAIDETALTSDDLTGARVYGSGDDWIGEIGQLVMADDGKVTHLVIDVGGWLGMGERPVALDFEQVDMRRVDGAGPVMVYVDFTQEELENLPQWTE